MGAAASDLWNFVGVSRYIMRLMAAVMAVTTVLLCSMGGRKAHATTEPVKPKHGIAAAERPQPVRLAASTRTVKAAAAPLRTPAQAPEHARQTSSEPAVAARSALSHAAKVGAVNAGAVGVMSEGASDHYVRMVADLASVFDDPPQLRVVGIVGRGTAQNLRDLRFLRGVDIALLHSDALDIATKLADGQDVAQKTSYIARLQDEEMHILAKNEIADVHQLAGRKVNVSLAGSGAAASSGNVFERLGIKVQLVNFPERQAEEKLKSGEIDAAVFWDPVPDDNVSSLNNDGRFHLLAVPYEKTLQSVYYPASIAADAYPGLTAAGQKLETISLNAVVVAYNWPPDSERNKRVARFAELLLSRFAELQKPGRDPIWQAIDPVGVAPGWQRLPAAQRWIDANVTRPAAQAKSPATADSAIAEFQTFLKEALQGGAAANPTAARKLFEEFIEWRQSKPESP
jgi:TRAP-type uncharacterized transport system substrate-binding protein